MTDIFDEYAFDDTVMAGVVEHPVCGWRHRCYNHSVADVLAEIRHHHNAEHPSMRAAVIVELDDEDCD